MANEGKDRQEQPQQGSTGQRSQGQGGGHQQHDMPGEHVGQQGGKAGSGGARNTQGNLGTTQRQWSGTGDVADSDEQAT